MIELDADIRQKRQGWEAVVVELDRVTVLSVAGKQVMER